MRYNKNKIIANNIWMKIINIKLKIYKLNKKMIIFKIKFNNILQKFKIMIKKSIKLRKIINRKNLWINNKNKKLISYKNN